jgi:hypothetical protein
MRWLVDAFEPKRKLGLSALARGVALVLRGVGRLTGRGFLEHMAEFVTELNHLFGGFKERARQVSAAFRGADFAYVLVSTPVPPALEERRCFSSGSRRRVLPVTRSCSTACTHVQARSCRLRTPKPRRGGTGFRQRSPGRSSRPRATRKPGRRRCRGARGVRIALREARERAPAHPHRAAPARG